MDRRRAPRISLDVDVDVSDAHNFYVGRTRDISEGGLFIESPIGIDEGTEVTIKLRIAGEPFVLACRVAWRLTSDDGRAVGFGVEFERLPLSARRAVQAYMRKRAPEVFEFGEPALDAAKAPEPEEEAVPASVARIPHPPLPPLSVPRPAPR